MLDKTVGYNIVNKRESLFEEVIVNDKDHSMPILFVHL